MKQEVILVILILVFILINWILLIYVIGLIMASTRKKQIPALHLNLAPNQSMITIVLTSSQINKRMKCFACYPIQGWYNNL